MPFVVRIPIIRDCRSDVVEHILPVPIKGLASRTTNATSLPISLFSLAMIRETSMALTFPESESYWGVARPAFTSSLFLRRATLLWFDRPSNEAMSIGLFSVVVISRFKILFSLFLHRKSRCISMFGNAIGFRHGPGYTDGENPLLLLFRSLLSRSFFCLTFTFIFIL